MNKFLQKRLDDISIEIVTGNKYDIRKVPFSKINEAMWLENLPSGCSVAIFPPVNNGAFYHLFVVKPEGVQYA